MRTREIKRLASKFNTQNSFLKFMLEQGQKVDTRIANAAGIANLRARLTELRKTGMKIVNVGEGAYTRAQA